jgi:hypothetical protein
MRLRQQKRRQQRKPLLISVRSFVRVETNHQNALLKALLFKPRATKKVF